MDLQPTDSSTQSWIDRPGLAETVVCAITALVYMATLSFGFVYDDVPQILHNPAVHEWRFVPQYFSSHVWAAIYPNTSGNYYRPIFLLWLRLNYALFGADAAGWHLTSVACHVLATWLVFRIVRQMAGDRATAFLAALIFGVHPAHIENVAWISGVTDPLMACFVLGSFSEFLEFRRAGGPWPAALSLGLFALGLLSKETAIVLPAVVVAYLLFARREEESRTGPGVPSTAGGTSALPSSALRSGALLSGFTAVALAYFVARFHALRGWSHSTITISWNDVFLSWPAVLWFYMKHLVCPVRLSEFYSLDYVPRATAAAVLVPLALLLVAAAAAALAIFLIHERFQKKLARFAVVLVIVPLLPVLDLHSLTAGDIVHDRYLYLPSVGFALLVALLIKELALCRPELRRGFMPVLVVTTAGVLAALTISQQMQWASDILLYTRGLESAPANQTVRDNLANALLAANQSERAIPLYLEVIERNPAFWRSNYNLGFAYYKTGNFAGAEDYLQRAIRIDSADSDQYIYLALAELQLKKLSEAAESAGRAITRNPQARGYHSVLGLIYETAGDRAHAVEQFRLEVGEHPDNAAAVAALQKLEGAPSAP